VEDKIKPGRVVLHFDNLFNGDKTLGELGNRLVNENVQLFIDDVKPPIEQSISKKIEKVMNQIFERAPIAEFMP